MHHVAVDTDILRQDPQRKSAAFRRLQQLIDEGHARLHIADVVRREFLSAVTTDYRVSLRKAEESLTAIRGDFLSEVAPDVRASLRGLRKGVGDKWLQDFNAWCRRANVAIHATPREALPSIIDSYFDGTPPFRAEKSRVDFPDALIWATIQNIVTQVGVLHFIVRDDVLARVASHANGVKQYSSIDAFLLATYGKLASRVDVRLFELLFANVKLLEGRAKSDLRYQLDGLLVESSKFAAGEAQIIDANVSHVAIKLPGAQNLGGGYFRFPFGASADVALEYEGHVGYWLDDADDQDLADLADDDDGDDDLAVTEGKVSVMGVLEVHVPYPASDDREYVSNEHLRRAMHTAEYEVVDLHIVGRKV